MSLPAMMRLMIEQVSQDLAAWLLELFTRRIRIPKRPGNRAVVQRGNESHNAIVFVGARQRELRTILVKDGVKPVGMVALACEALQPNPVCQQQMVQRPVQALEERPNVAPVVGIPERQGGLIQPRVGPTIVGCELLKVLLHG